MTSPKDMEREDISDAKDSPGFFGAGKKLLDARAEIKRLQSELEEKEQRVHDLSSLLERYESGSVEGFLPERLVWVLGAGRTGSTWMAAMVGDMDGQSVWFEPRVGDVFAPYRFERYGGQNFVMANRYRRTWLRNIRQTVLDGANVRFPEAAAAGDYLLIKEPGGSSGATVLMESLPESAMVFLIRDPRDVVASWLDAATKGGWQSERKRDQRRREETFADQNPDAFVRSNALAYARNIGTSSEAYKKHSGRKVLIRYEELVEDTYATMKRMYESLSVPFDEKQLSKVVEKHSWSNIPEEEKGEGKFYRKGQPGGWREDLTRRQVRIVEKATSDLLKEYYPDGTKP